MRLGTKIWESGWGAVFLTVYGFLATHLIVPKSYFLYPISLFPTLSVMFCADRFSSYLVDFFAGGELRRSTDRIHQITGEDHFYHATSEELRTTVDDFDRRAYEQNISILSGILIAVSAPGLGYVIRGEIGFVAGLAISIVALWLLCHQGIKSLKELAEQIVEPYEANYEN